MKASLTERQKNIFGLVVREYILNAEPISSRRLAKKYTLNLSSATIRNVMADLEDLGFLSQPHTSAGRMPTDQGFRFYVDSIIENKELSFVNEKAIREKYRKSSPEFPVLFQETSKILSEFSHGTGVVMAPRIIDAVFWHIEFILLKKGKILAVFVSQSGLVQKKAVEIEEHTISQDELNKYSRYLNETFAGMKLVEVRRRIKREMQKEENRYNELLSRALRMGHTVLADDSGVEVYVEGRANFLEYPEFGEIEKMKTIFKMLEEKTILLSILDKAMENSGVQIFIGSENHLSEMEDCSFVLSSYSRDKDVLGALGVVGPTRMNYFCIIPVVEYIANLLSTYLAEE
ncbi:MAG: heat-inducible transcription repressor HrcA [Deltaproteobacteria bacterium]|nr:heat-inducible transcription repressor HrcA [Deltaproteobacteria bacterium]